MRRLLIIGAGFAGMYAAISAARLRHLQGVSPDELEIAMAAFYFLAGTIVVANLMVFVTPIGSSK